MGAVAAIRILHRRKLAEVPRDTLRAGGGRAGRRARADRRRRRQGGRDRRRRRDHHPRHHPLALAQAVRVAAAIGVHGDIMIHEDRLKQAMLADALGRQPLGEGVAELLGARWDAELEPFRQAADGAPVRWLHQVG